MQGSARCTSCPQNATSLAASESLDDCYCPVGFFGPNIGPCKLLEEQTGGCLSGFTKTEDYWWEPCVNCELGKYKQYHGSGPCTQCPEHTSTEAPSQRNSTSIDDCGCSPGFSGSASVCDICPVDTYKEELGNFACVYCPLHTASPQGSTTHRMCTCKQGFLWSEVCVCACVCTCPCVHILVGELEDFLYMHKVQTCTRMRLTQDKKRRSLLHTHTHTHPPH